MKRLAIVAVLLLAAGCAETTPPRAPAAPRSVVLFVPDGLRALVVNAETAPAMAALREQGVAFANSHSLLPTFTTPNAAAMATGHYLGDTGNYGNTIYTGYPVPTAGGSVTPFLESDPVLGDVDQHFGGNYLNETAILRAAAGRGISTAIIGKLGPALIFDHTDRTGTQTIVIDDSTGTPAGIPLSPEMIQRLGAAGLPAATPGRGANGSAGSATTPGTAVSNTAQQQYFADVATKVVLPMFKERDKAFVLVFWSRDPDGTQHNQGDSLNRLVPGINGPTSLAAIKNADANLAQLRSALASLGLAGTTNVVVAADHGMATISKESKTSGAARASYGDVPAGLLPPGFLALDLGAALGLPVFDPDARNARIAPGRHPLRSNGLIGEDPSRPEVIVAANGGSDLVYLPTRDKGLAARVVAALLGQDYVSGLFVDDSLGSFPGTLPLSAINLKGTAVTPTPAIVVNFRTYSTGCPQPFLCTAEIADTTLQQGQGMHGTFGRADTMNFMAAVGPDFKVGFIDPAPVGNADVGMTIAEILGLRISSNGKLMGRVMTEAMPGGRLPAHETRTIRSEPSEAGLRTVLRYQLVGSTAYFDAAGAPGRSIGLDE